MVPAHAPAFAAHQAPDREHPDRILFPMLHHRTDHVRVALRMEQAEERVLRPVGIPEGENGIVRKAFCPVDVPVDPAVLSVHVHVDRGVDHRMVKGGVEHRQFGVRPLRPEAGQFLFPRPTRPEGDFIERAAPLRPEVPQRPGSVYC